MREAYLKIAEENRERIYKINGIDTIENIHKRILEHVGEKLVLPWDKDFLSSKTELSSKQFFTHLRDKM